ncbi:hypothetical protein AB0G86_25070 [Streptomyces scabiei]|uniref:hypothetical protein n=1 Tax=Streptomyces scabiei TaxID=1930 RepID=UPI0033E281F9
MTNNRIQGDRMYKRNERVLAAFEMRLQGMTPQEIGDKLGVTSVTVGNYIKEELDNRLTPMADEERRHQLASLDKLIREMWRIIDNDEPLYQYGKTCYMADGKTPAIDTKRKIEACAELRKLLDARARLTGAYKPFQTQTEVTHTTPADAALASLVEQMEAKNKAMQAELAG